MAVGVDHVAFDVEAGAVVHRALDHGGDLGGRAVDQLGVNGGRLLLDVPVDEDAAAESA
jgi:hypothetical protein